MLVFKWLSLLTIRILYLQPKTLWSVTLHQLFLSVDSTSRTCAHHINIDQLLSFTTSVFHNSTRDHNISTSSTFSYLIAPDSQLKVICCFLPAESTSNALYTFHSKPFASSHQKFSKYWMVKWFEWFMTFIDFFLVELFSFNIAL